MRSTGVLLVLRFALSFGSPRQMSGQPFRCCREFEPCGRRKRTTPLTLCRKSSRQLSGGVSNCRRLRRKRRGADKKLNQDGVKKSRKKRWLDLEIAATVR